MFGAEFVCALCVYMICFKRHSLCSFAMCVFLKDILINYVFAVVLCSTYCILGLLILSHLGDLVHSQPGGWNLPLLCNFAFLNPN